MLLILRQAEDQVLESGRGMKPTAQPIKSRGWKCVELYLHSPVRVYGTWLKTGAAVLSLYWTCWNTFNTPDLCSCDIPILIPAEVLRLLMVHLI